MMRRNLVRAVVVGLLFSTFGVGAYQSRERIPVCDVHPASAKKAAHAGSSKEREELLLRLAAREAELEKLRSDLNARDDAALYMEATALGIVDAVKASGLPARQQKRIAVAIVREAKANGLDPLLVVAVIRTESSFNNYAVSHVGAMGFMQVMPDTGAWLMSRKGNSLGRKHNLFDSELNIELGAAYLAELVRKFGNVEKALVAYNAGPTAARRILSKEDVAKRFIAGYPHKVLRDFQKLKSSADTRRAEQVKPPVPDGRG